MTNENRIKKLKDLILTKVLEDNAPSNAEYIKLAISALEYRIPKKPILIGNDYDSALSCPNCKQAIINVWNKKNYNPRYCHYCGQALDWRDD